MSPVFAFTMPMKKAVFSFAANLVTKDDSALVQRCGRFWGMGVRGKGQREHIAKGMRGARVHLERRLDGSRWMQWGTRMVAQILYAEAENFRGAQTARGEKVKNRSLRNPLFKMRVLR